MFDYKLIEAFAFVIEEGGFEKAAERLYLTQSAVSQRVRLLEEMSGTILLTRSSPPEPTPAGIRFLKHYQQVKRLEFDLDATLSPRTGDQKERIGIALNADSLETWFLDAVSPFLKNNPNITLDIKTDDQEETHKMLKNGEVAGCISARKTAVQGCTATHVRLTRYRMTATPGFAETHFPEGLTESAVMSAPAVIFNRKDNLHEMVLKKVFHKTIRPIPAHYVPSTEIFADFILKGFAYGVIPDEQGKAHIDSGRLIDLAPECHIPVDLYWHCWNIKSGLLDELTKTLSG